MFYYVEEGCLMACPMGSCSPCPSWARSSFGCDSSWTAESLKRGSIVGLASLWPCWYSSPYGLHVAPPSHYLLTMAIQAEWHQQKKKKERKRMEIRIICYWLPRRISTWEKRQWGSETRQKFPTERRWVFRRNRFLRDHLGHSCLSPGVALQSSLSPPHSRPFSSLRLGFDEWRAAGWAGGCVWASTHWEWPGGAAESVFSLGQNWGGGVPFYRRVSWEDCGAENKTRLKDRRKNNWTYLSLCRAVGGRILIQQESWS